MADVASLERRIDRLEAPLRVLEGKPATPPPPKPKPTPVYCGKCDAWY